MSVEEAINKIIDDFEKTLRARLVDVMATDRIDVLKCVFERESGVREEWEVRIGDEDVVFRREKKVFVYKLGDYR